MNESSHRPMKLLWLQSGGCGGCTMSLMGAEAPDLYTSFKAAGIELLWHPSLSEATGSEVEEIIADILSDKIELDIFCLEGSVVQGPNGSGLFHKIPGSHEPMRDRIKALAEKAHHVVAVGSCAAFGGITTAGGNPSESCGLQYDGDNPGGLLGSNFTDGSGLPVVNIAGCPTHPNWVLETLTQLSMAKLEQETFDEQQLDEWKRPRNYTDHLVHHGCPRNEFYEYKASAENHSDMGCMMENLGCLGTQARADCNTRLWNGEGSCVRGGYACINCTAPKFEEPGHLFQSTPKIGGIPIGLPTDMPKAWFVALASLAKAATPVRLKENAIKDHTIYPPGNKDKGK